MKYNILFISSLCSKEVFDFIHETSFDKSGQAIQKFHYLLTKGLAFHKDNNIEIFTSLPISSKTHKKKFWNLKKEKHNEIHFSYIPTINLSIVKNIIDFIYAFSKILFWNMLSSSNDKIIIVDVLKLSASFGAFIACKIRRIKYVSIVTDMPGIDVFEKTTKSHLKSKLIKSFLTRSDGFILITVQMNSIVNPKNKPFIVIEGLVDQTMSTISNEISKKAKEIILIYSGGIYERYGVKKLIEAFSNLKSTNLRLHIYGAGSMEKSMQNYMANDCRMKYKGIVPNDILVAEQIKATLLINPRPSNEELTKYSFPSKNMEYMVSGTPTVTTRLKGMPSEYLPYVFLFEDESIEGITNTLQLLLAKPIEELHAFGLKAKEFMLFKKNNIIQGQKVTIFLRSVLKNK